MFLEPPLHGDLVQVYYKAGDRTQSKCLSLCTVLYYKTECGIVAVPPSSCRAMHDAVADVPVAIYNDYLAVHVLETSDPIDFILGGTSNNATADGDQFVANLHDESMHAKCFGHDSKPISHDADPLSVISDVFQDADNTIALFVSVSIDIFGLLMIATTLERSPA